MALHFGVTFQFENVKKMYSNAFKHIDWPEFPFKVMDIGCGSGRLLKEILVPMLPNNYSYIMGTDYSEEMINHCKTLEVDPRITFDMMDISSRTIPEKFVNNFDFLFSSFALHYVKDIRHALTNCKTLLKPNGELVVIYLYTSFPLYEIYKRMSNIEEWRPYTKDFMNYSPHLGPDNPIDIAKQIFEDCGLEICNIQLNDDPYESTALGYLELFQSVDEIFYSIPKEKRMDYRTLFTELLGDIMGLSYRDSKKKTKYHFGGVLVHARKSS